MSDSDCQTKQYVTTDGQSPPEFSATDINVVSKILCTVLQTLFIIIAVM